MPAKEANIACDLEPYLQYHNRIASFLGWRLDWEVNQGKPSPERLARAGFFYHPKPPYEGDTVVCPYCTLALDSWEPQDDPVREHRTRSPFCDFVLGRQRVRDMSSDDKEASNIIAAGTASVRAPNSEPGGTNDEPQPNRVPSKRAAGAAKANDLPLAGADSTEESPPAKKRRSGRPKGAQ